MTNRQVLEPTPSHPITVLPTGSHVVVRVNGQIVAETDAALTLQESSYPAVQYVPLADVTSDLLRPSDTETYCPYKGDASYFDVVVDGVRARDEGLAGKPAPDTYLRAAELVDIDPASCAVVEDAVSGVRAAVAGGVGVVIGVDRGVGTDVLRDNGATLVVNDLEELLA